MYSFFFSSGGENENTYLLMPVASPVMDKHGGEKAGSEIMRDKQPVGIVKVKHYRCCAILQKWGCLNQLSCSCKPPTPPTPHPSSLPFKCEGTVMEWRTLLAKADTKHITHKSVLLLHLSQQKCVKTGAWWDGVKKRGRE